MKRRFPSLEVAFFDVVEILHIVVSVNRYIVPLNFYKYMDKERFHFDFVAPSKIGFSEEFERLCPREIRYYPVPERKKNPLKYKRELEKIFLNHASEYDAVWINVPTLINIEYLKLAKKYNIKKRIVHSHNSDNLQRGLLHWLHLINKRRIAQYATDFWACSDEAAAWLYPKRIQKKYEFIRNAIDIETFLFDNLKRERLRAELEIAKDDFVIGHVGRIHFQKNQEYVLEIFREVVKKRPNAKLVFVGGGGDSNLREYAEHLGILDKVLFLGVRSDIADLYNLFDFYLFPSRYEGFGIVLLEAQANGLPILASDIITKQVIINDNLNYLALDKGAKVWADSILANVEDTKRVDKAIVIENFSKNNFVLEKESKRLEELFLR